MESEFLRAAPLTDGAGVGWFDPESPAKAVERAASPPRARASHERTQGDGGPAHDATSLSLMPPSPPLDASRARAVASRLRRGRRSFRQQVAPELVVRSPAQHLWHEVSLRDRKSTRLNSSHLGISYAVFCLNKKRL